MNESRYELTYEEIQYLVAKTANDIFGALAHKGIHVDTDGVVTARVTLHINEQPIMFHLKLLDRVSVQVEPFRAAESADDIEAAVMGFRNRHKGQ